MPRFPFLCLLQRKRPLEHRRVSGFGLPFILDGFSGDSSAMNSAQQKSDCWLSGTSSWCPSAHAVPICLDGHKLC